MFVARFRTALIASAAVLAVHVAPVRANEELYRKVAQATVYVSRNDGPQGNGLGTGFLIDAKERLVITARHVVETKTGLADVVAVVFAQSKDGDIITESEYYRNNWNTLAIRGKIVYESVRRDMAVLQLDKVPAGVKPLELAEKKARPGQTIHVIGNSTVVLGGMFNYCHGTVRNTFRYVTGANVLATQAPTNRGDSGGPVFNNLGEVVGFCSLSTGRPAAKNDPLAGDQNVDLSICVTEIRAGLDEMRGLVAKGPALPVGKTITLKGQAQPSVHLAHMEKDSTYRILIVADGFNPELRIEQPGDKLIAQNPFQNSAQGIAGKMEMLFTANETGEHRLHMGFAPNSDLHKGPFKYSLTINKASFESEKVVKEPDLPLNEHVRKFESGKVYDISVKAKSFEPDLRVLDGGKTVSSQFNNGVKGPGGDFETTLRFFADRTADFRIHVNISPFSPPHTDPRPYQLVVKETKTELMVREALTVKDPLYMNSGPFKAHAVKLQANKTYQIDIITTKFDSRLVLEDSAGKFVAAGFEIGTFNARLIYRPTKTDTFRIIATSHQIDASGAYNLIVAENTNASGAFFPPLDKKMPKNDK